MHGGTLSSWHQREAGTGAAGSGAAPQYASASEVERSTTCVCDSSCRCACGPRLGMWELWSEGGVSRVLTTVWKRELGGARVSRGLHTTGRARGGGHHRKVESWLSATRCKKLSVRCYFKNRCNAV